MEGRWRSKVNSTQRNEREKRGEKEDERGVRTGNGGGADQVLCDGLVSHDNGDRAETHAA
jgi:hypothetical protein